jgi:ADP-heptose:LPS heptosyltransferase
LEQGAKLTRTGTRIRVSALAGRYLKAAFRSVLAARYGGRVSGNAKPSAHPSVLVIRGDGGIGDFVLFLPSLRELRRHYAGSKFTLLVGSESAAIASSFTDVDEVIPFEVRRYRLDLAYRIRLIQQLRRRQFDVALNPIYSREPLTDELLYCSGARERIACEGDLCNIGRRTKSENNSYCTRVYPSTSGRLPESERNREFVEHLVGAAGWKGDFQPGLQLLQSHIDGARGLLRRQGLDLHTDLIVGIFPGASNAIRIWPVEHFARLADFFADKYGARVLIGGSPSEMALGERIIQLCKTSPSNLVGKTTLPELAAVMRLCSLFVGSESGPLHLAAAVGTPTLCIMGGGHFGRFYPYGDPRTHGMAFKQMDCFNCDWRCIHESVRCIQEIPFDAAWRESQRMMEEVVLPARESCFQESSRPTP